MSRAKFKNLQKNLNFLEFLRNFFLKFFEFLKKFDIKIQKFMPKTAKQKARICRFCAFELLAFQTLPSCALVKPLYALWVLMV